MGRRANPRHNSLMNSMFRAWPMLAFALWTGAATAEDKMLEVTSDTVVYCGELHERVETLMRAPAHRPTQEVVQLATEGQRMCDQGLARGGILRLRRALSIMMRPGEEP